MVAGACRSHLDKRLEDNVFPRIGSKPIRDVTSDDFLGCMDRMIERGAYYIARRVLQITKKVFKWAVGRKLVAVSPVAHIEPRDELPKRKVSRTSFPCPDKRSRCCVNCSRSPAPMASDWCSPACAMLRDL